MLAICVCGAAAYSNSFDGVFVLDDKTAIAANPTIRTLRPVATPLAPPRDTAVAGRPIANLSFAITYALAPRDARDVFAAGSGADAARLDRLQRNAWTYHAVNLGIHLAAACVLFGVVRRTLSSTAGREPVGNRADVLGLAIAAIWVVHPLTTAAVTYIVQRVEALAGLLYLVTMYCAIRARDRLTDSAQRARGTRRSETSGERGRTRWAIAAIAACALGMATKESFVTAPLMVVAWDWLMLREPWRAMVARRWPLYAGLAATWMVLAAILAASPRSASVGIGLHGVSSWTYLTTQAGVVAHYVRAAIVPWPLALDYEWPLAASVRDVLLPAALVLTLAVATLLGIIRRAPWSFAGVWFLLILTPTSSVIPIVTEVAADHRMYLPLAAVMACVVLVLYRSAKSLALHLSSVESPALHGAWRLAVAAIVVALGALTYARNAEFASEERLYAADVARRPANARARSNLASILIEQGRLAEAETLLRERAFAGRRATSAA